jgi:hypothetical protein
MHKYTLKQKKYKKIFKKFHKERYVYVPAIDDILVGCKLYHNGFYYGTVVEISRKIIYVNNDLKPMEVPDPFLKENFYSKGFKIEYPKEEID